MLLSQQLCSHPSHLGQPTRAHLHPAPLLCARGAVVPAHHGKAGGQADTKGAAQSSS